MNNILISIIIPVYNVKNYLVVCLDSIFVNQVITHPIEVIAIDDGSNDGSEITLDDYASKYVNLIILKQNNRGVGAARNAGIRVASGKYLMFLDSDDFFLPFKLDQFFNCLARTNADIVEYDGYGASDDGTVIYKHNIVRKCLSNLSKDVFAFWVKSDCLCTGVYNRAVKSDVIYANGLLFPEGIYWEDEQWCAKIFAYATSIVYFPVALMAIRQRPGSLSRSNNQKSYFDYISIIDDLYDLSITYKDCYSFSNALKMHISDLLFNAMRGIGKSGNYDVPLESAIKKRIYMIKYSRKWHRKYIYRYIIHLFGLKAFRVIFINYF